MGCRKLAGRDAWRVRVGDYLILYEIHDQRLVVWWWPSANVAIATVSPHTPSRWRQAAGVAWS